MQVKASHLGVRSTLQPTARMSRPVFVVALLLLCILPTWSQVPTTFFGISLNNATDYPTANGPKFGLLRLWDTPNTHWPYLQQNGYNTALSTTYLDDALNGACINSPGYSAGTSCGNAVVMYTFGRVPSWASENSNHCGHGTCL